MAAVFAMGSDGERSSPVERGVWVLRKLLHDPPPPAPANVPQLSRLEGKLLPVRKLIDAHMEEAQCAQCHRNIDPIGYGLEHFNAVGLWRNSELVSGSHRKTKEFPKTLLCTILFVYRLFGNRTKQMCAPPARPLFRDHFPFSCKIN